MFLIVLVALSTPVLAKESSLPIQFSPKLSFIARDADISEIEVEPPPLCSTIPEDDPPYISLVLLGLHRPAITPSRHCLLITQKRVTTSCYSPLAGYDEKKVINSVEEMISSSGEEVIRRNNGMWLTELSKMGVEQLKVWKDDETYDCPPIIGTQEKTTIVYPYRKVAALFDPRGDLITPFKTALHKGWGHKDGIMVFCPKEPPICSFIDIGNVVAHQLNTSSESALYISESGDWMLHDSSKQEICNKSGVHYFGSDEGHVYSLISSRRKRRSVESEARIQYPQFVTALEENHRSKRSPHLLEYPANQREVFLLEHTAQSISTFEGQISQLEIATSKQVAASINEKCRNRYRSIMMAISLIKIDPRPYLEFVLGHPGFLTVKRDDQYIGVQLGTPVGKAVLPSTKDRLWCNGSLWMETNVGTGWLTDRIGVVREGTKNDTCTFRTSPIKFRVPTYRTGTLEVISGNLIGYPDSRVVDRAHHFRPVLFHKMNIDEGSSYIQEFKDETTKILSLECNPRSKRSFVSSMDTSSPFRLWAMFNDNLPTLILGLIVVIATKVAILLGLSCPRRSSTSYKRTGFS